MSEVICSYSGIIEEISLKNFMCHEAFRIVLNTKVNFISGKNGSGKSAILTALVVGLGGRAILTDRAKNMQSFIKNKQKNAEVTICLKNDGEKSFCSEIYGNKIIIVRLIDQKHTSIKIKSENGKLISSKLDELKRILQHFNIQIENPLCILNQDVSRTFLYCNSSSDKYKFFLKATELETINETLKAATEDSNTMKAEWESLKEIRNKLNEEYIEIKKRYQAINSLEELGEKLQTKKNELLWSEVIELEDKIISLENDLEKKRNEKEEVEDELIKLSQNDSSSFPSFEIQIQDLKKKIEEINRKKQSVCQSRERLLESIKTIQSDIDFENILVKKKIDSKKELECEIHEKDTHHSETETEKRQEKQNLEQKLIEISALLSTTNNDLIQAQGSLEDQITQEKDSYSELQKLKIQLNKKKEQFEYYNSNPSDQYAVYGPKTHQVINAIKEKKYLFKQSPVGPAGLYVTLKDSKWATSIEYNLGADTFTAYIVDNIDDQKHLLEIFNSIYKNESMPPVICSKFLPKLHNVQKHKVENAYCLFDQLIIKNVVVGNYLIDFCEIESILLVETDDLAMQLMSKIQNVPKNCRTVFTLAGDRYYPFPNFRTYGAKRNIYNKYLQADCQGKIHYIEKDVKNLEEQIKNANNLLIELRNDIKNQQKNINNLEMKRKQLIENESNIQIHLSNINVQFDRINVDNFDYLKKCLEEVIKDIDQRKQLIERKQEEVTNLREKEQTLKNDIDVVNNEYHELFKKKTKLEEEFKNEHDIVKSIENKRHRLSIKLEILNKNYNDYENEMKLLQESFKNKLAIAKERCDRFKCLQPYDKIYNECQKLEYEYKDAELHIGDFEEIKKKYMNLREEYKSVVTALDASKVNLDNYIEGLKKREQNIKQLTKTITNQIKACFQEVLSYRQFKGHLKIDHESQTLDIFVVPFSRQNKENTEPENVITLSGGERSYSTVAFILSLWCSMNSPFHFLDEFDVFMDRVNRQIAMELLLIFARNNNRSQFVFLTPQDISDIRAAEDLSIHRLQDPEK